MRRWRRYQCIRQIVVCGLIFPALLSCERSKEEPAFQDSRETASPSSSGSLPGESTDPTLAAVPTQPHPIGAEVSSAPSYGTVMISGELELMVTGEGAGDPERSSEVLEQQLLAFLP